MYVHVDTDAATAEVREPEDLQRLHVTVAGGGPPEEAARLLAPFGRLDGEHAWLRVAALRAAGPADPAWVERFEGMISYASAKGWTDETGSVRAHLERA